MSTDVEAGREKATMAVNLITERLHVDGISDEAAVEFLEADFLITEAADLGLDSLQRERRQPLELQADLIQRPGEFGNEVLHALREAGPVFGEVPPEVASRYANTVLEPLIERMRGRIQLSETVNSVTAEISYAIEIVRAVLTRPENFNAARADGFDRPHIAKALSYCGSG